MSFRTLLDSLKSRPARAATRPTRRADARGRWRPGMERLEDRVTPATILVDTFADGFADDGRTSLREAIRLAADPATHAGNDTIILPREIDGVAGTYALSPVFRAVPLGISDTTGGLTIQSSGGRVTVDARLDTPVIDFGQVFVVSSPFVVEFRGLTITGGNTSGGGGGILNLSGLRLTDCTVSGNSADSGGGILSRAALTVTDSAITGNRGGGVRNESGHLTVTDSTVGGNAGDGIYSRAPLTVTGSTITRNAGTGVAVHGVNFLRLLDNTITSNSFHGVSVGLRVENGIEFPSTNGLIGTPDAGNAIAFNGMTGVTVVAGSTGIAVRGNSIFGNTGPEIDLDNDGLTANDPGDADGGSNRRQNFPVLTSAVSGGEGTTLAGAINGTPSTILLVDCYASPPGGPGQTYLGTAAVLTDGNGNALFTASFPKPVAEGWAVAATATTIGSAPYGDTSEFSPGISVFVPGDPAPTNQAPVNRVPSYTQGVTRNRAFTFSSARGNAVSVSDPDAGATLIQVSLTVEHGTLTLAGTAGLTFLVGDGRCDGTVAFRGTVAAVNAALNGLVYRPADGYVGSDALRIITDDLGSGLGDPLIDTDLVTILVGQKKK